MIVLSSLWLGYRNNVLNPDTLLGNSTFLGSWPGFRPSWTTEQLEPRFAYAQYATDLDYLCNCAINFARLNMFGATYDKVLIFPEDWSSGSSKEAIAMRKFHSDYPDVELRPFGLLSTAKGDATWRNSLTKFHAFALTDYTRVLAFDSDSLVMQSMDHYFLAPLAPVAVPRAYWLNDDDAAVGKQLVGSHIMLIEPNQDRYKQIIDEALASGDFDMEIVNRMFGRSAMILPHRRLAMLSGELRATNHSKYLAPDVGEEWNAMGEISRAYLVHFSDWPLPKPWKHRTQKQWEAALPICRDDDVETEDKPRCADRFMWSGLYQDYDDGKERHCKFRG
ncbi:nucleotide-diphospho-sugar transferase [Ilyonectria robusta]|uniref:nucleotide-diphospho-sugar transferase n=1 Tax=Ilyonectria robusta TaxID=1079257 RepID=UPI001E8EA9E1|nr:nucleotide-diphospho-sugar transferase [Ilyonectria robusta]KAH8665555.1 nucleotide-diphospho-sugar transferase [Ilyonectria robusta]